MSENLVSIVSKLGGYHWEIPGEAEGFCETYNEAVADCVHALVRRGHFVTASRVLDGEITGHDPSKRVEMVSSAQG